MCVGKSSYSHNMKLWARMNAEQRSRESRDQIVRVCLLQGTLRNERIEQDGKKAEMTAETG